jgi:hypothetical protein
MMPETNESPNKQTEHTITPGNPFANLDALRNPQDYEEFLGGEAVTAFPVRTLKEGMHLRVNSDNQYSLLGVYTIATRRGVYFVYPQFRDALGPLPRRCNLHVAVDGHGVYFLLLVKQPNPGQGQDDNPWYTSARRVTAAGMQEWVKVTKAPGDGGWGHVPVRHEMFKPTWPTRSFEELLNNAFPDMVVNSLNHDLIQQYEERGA